MLVILIPRSRSREPRSRSCARESLAPRLAWEEGETADALRASRGQTARSNDGCSLRGATPRPSRSYHIQLGPVPSPPIADETYEAKIVCGFRGSVTESLRCGSELGVNRAPLRTAGTRPTDRRAGACLVRVRWSVRDRRPRRFHAECRRGGGTNLRIGPRVLARKLRHERTEQVAKV
jgi:hypothetical protein